MIAEFAGVPSAKASQTTGFFAGIAILPQPPGIAEVIRHYVRHRIMPNDAAGDAGHLAIASMHSIDFILTWNCKHLANASKQRHIS